jgi:hypothetical protein
MFGIPFLLQYLLDTYGLRGTTLLGSCLWLSVGLAGGLFGKGVTSIEEEENIETFIDKSIIIKTENEIEHPIITRRRSDTSSIGLIYSRRTSLLPNFPHHHQQHKRLSSLYQQHCNSDKLMINMPTIYEGFTSNPRDRSRRFVEISKI